MKRIKEPFNSITHKEVKKLQPITNNNSVSTTPRILSPASNRKNVFSSDAV